MMDGHEKSDLVIVAVKPANKAKKAHCGGICGGGRSGVGGANRRAGAKGNAHRQSTYWTLSQARVSKALERIRPLVPSYTRGRSRVRESRTHGSVRAVKRTSLPLQGFFLLHLLTSAFVQVFGRRRRLSNHALRRPASEKRQGTKSRREMVRRRCRRRVVRRDVRHHGESWKVSGLRTLVALLSCYRHVRDERG